MRLELSPDIHDRWKVDVKIEALTDNNTSSPLDHVFAVNWASPDDKQKIVASFTRGISTFTGDVVTRVQFTSNGSLPQEAVMKDVLASMLEAGQKEIGKRQWGEKVQAANDGTFEPAYIAPVMRIHAFEEPAIVSALKDLKAATRSLGPHPMLPLIVDFKTTPEEKLAFKPKEAASHDAVRPMDISNRPYFNFELAA
ncbi:MAG: hypothetical protein WAO98_08930 [Alphaproteobacteria bacterium]